MKPSIVIIDDEPAVLDVLVEYLQDGDFDVSGFTEPMKAVKSIQDGIKCDLIFFDYNLTNTTSVIYIERVRNMGNFCPIILMTGNVTTDVLNAGIKFNASTVVAKPISYENFKKIALDVLELEKKKISYYKNKQP